MFARLYGLRNGDEAARSGLDRFGIGHLARAMGTELSSGQKTLVGIVKAALHRPACWSFDEPTASLDPDVALRVREGLRELCESYGTALLVTSHNMVEVERLCERVVFLFHGRWLPTAHRPRSPSGSVTTDSKACSCTSPGWATTSNATGSGGMSHDR